MKKAIKSILSALSEHLFITLLSLFFAACFAGITLSIPFFNPIAKSLANFSLIDVYYQALHSGTAPDTSQVISIVDIGEEASRSRLARVVDSVNMAEPSVVVFDVIFNGLRGDTAGSMALLEAISNTTSPRFAFAMTDYDAEKNTFTHLYRSFFNISDDLGLEGYVNVKESEGGEVVRKFSEQRRYMGDTLYSLAFMAASAFDEACTTQGTVQVPVDFTPVELPANTLLSVKPATSFSADRIIDFSPTHFPVVRYDQVSGAFDNLKGRIVIIGALHDLQDNHNTTIGRMDGPEVLAYSVQTLLENKKIESLSSPVQWISTILLLLFTQILTFSFSAYIFKNQKKNLFTKFGAYSSTYGAIVKTIWLAILTFMTFYAFVAFGKSFDLLWLLMGIAFLGFTNGCYKAVIQILAEKNPKSIFAKSIIYKTYGV